MQTVAAPTARGFTKSQCSHLTVEGITVGSQPPAVAATTSTDSLHLECHALNSGDFVGRVATGTNRGFRVARGKGLTMNALEIRRLDPRVTGAAGRGNVAACGSAPGIVSAQDLVRPMTA